MIWKNRQKAGQELALKLLEYKNYPNAIVLGLPRGGVIVAHEVARELNLPLDIIVTRKIGAPGEPELAIGAIDENGAGEFNKKIISAALISEDYIKTQIEEQKKEIRRRLQLYRQRKPPLDLKNKIAILIDDGIATGHTMFAAISSCKSKGAKEVIIAAPAIAPDTISKLEQVADKIVYLEAPMGFAAVGQFYEEFEQVSDKEVIGFLNYE